MPEKDQPPQRIWLNDEAINEHFERLKASYANGGTGDDGEVVPLQQNEMTKGLRSG